jgi:chorismate-pyruvate lyase
MSVLNPLSLSQRRMPVKQILTGLSRFQRMFLVADGTVTEMLEQYLAEKIKVLKLYEKIESDTQKISPRHRDFLEQADVGPVLEREVLLQGQHTLNNWVHAESTILLNHLEQGFRTDLLASREPIGRLWEKYQVETFKSILDFEKRPTGDLAEHFGISPAEALISRTYNVYSGGKLIMIITEAFPARFFQD